MTRPTTKHDLATEAVERALTECATALSKLGGRTVHKPKEVPPPKTFISRQYLESVISRLRVVQVLLHTKEELFPTRFPGVLQTQDGSVVTTFSPTELRDAFEKEYDNNRKESTYE